MVIGTKIKRVLVRGVKQLGQFVASCIRLFIGAASDLLPRDVHIRVEHNLRGRAGVESKQTIDSSNQETAQPTHHQPPPLTHYYLTNLIL